MINRIHNLNQYQKSILLKSAKEILSGWEENGQPIIVENYLCKFNNEDESEMVLYKCECGHLIADYEDYSGRDVDTDRCSKCNRHYDYTEEELRNL